MSDELLYRYFKNEVSPQEVKEIEEWLAADPVTRQREFDAAHMLFNAMVLQESGWHSEKETGDRKVHAVPVSGKGTGRAWWHTACRVAAAVALLAGAGYAGMYINQKMMYKDFTSRMNVIEVPAGEMLSLTLQDGTEVFLNGGSRLEYPAVFAKDRRQVHLSGEAYMDAAHNPDRPFVVETFASEVEVLGTEFNVLADEDNGFFSTTLVSGKVKVTTLGTDEYEQVILAPDEKVRIVDNHLVVSRVKAKDDVSWTGGYINLRDVSFVELMRRFESMYGVNIVIARDSIPDVGYLSGKIRVSEGIDFALHILQEACDFTYEKDSGTDTVIIR